MDIKNKKVHFIAAGGAGMSALALFLAQQGALVSGSDIQESKYTHLLADAGIKVHIGHNPDLIQKDMMIVSSSAIHSDNPELIRAAAAGLKVHHRSDVLKMISDEFSADKSACFIGFSGTHGKTTTSGLASFVLEKAGFKPSYILGGVLPEINTNGKYAGDKYFIAELDESDGTIEKYAADITVINNMELDHLDRYKGGFREIAKVFNASLKNKPGQKVIINDDDKGCRKFMQMYPNYNYITFGMDFTDYSVRNIKLNGLKSSFDLCHDGRFLTSLNISIPGKHNIYNALAVSAALMEAGININAVKQYFTEFTGMARRFQKAAQFGGITVYDDYAHHPSEIKAVLSAAREAAGSGRRITAVFQPHRYSRFEALWEDFKKAFADADIVYVTDVYSAGERPKNNISSERFAKEMDRIGVKYVKGNMKEAAKIIFPLLKPNDIVLTLGAGDITNLAGYLQKESMDNAGIL